MEFEEILRIEDDLQRNDALYSVFNEESGWPVKLDSLNF